MRSPPESSEFSEFSGENFRKTSERRRGRKKGQRVRLRPGEKPASGIACKAFPGVIHTQNHRAAFSRPVKLPMICRKAFREPCQTSREGATNYANLRKT